MRKFFTVIAFMVAAIGLFAGYSNFGIPQIEPAPPPVEEKIDLGSMTMEQYIAFGERLFKGKGTCTLCHNSLGRAPALDAIATNAQARLEDPRYEGEATDIEEYLIESLVSPSAFVVVGFGKKGTNDTQSPMPDASSGSISFSEAEVTAVIAYLQDNAGLEVTVEIPSDLQPVAEEDEDGEPREAFTQVQDIIENFDCEACHTITEEAGDAGPNLSSIGVKRDRAYLRKALLDPNADIAEGFEEDLMPDDLGQQIYASELEILLDYLTVLR